MSQLPHKPLRIGLTGGIGSGKSTVARIFEVLGIPVYYADLEARRIMNEDELLRQQVIKHFGKNAYRDGRLDNKYVGAIVFNDREKLDLLNSIVHPATIRDSERWMQNQKSPYTIKEAALIFESNAQEHLDYVIGISAPEPLRILRTMQRDGINREAVLIRMHKQIQEVIKMRLCDFIIYNDEQQLVIPQVLKLHQILIGMQQDGSPL